MAYRTLPKFDPSARFLVTARLPVLNGVPMKPGEAMPEEPARRGDGYAEWRSRSTVLPHSDCQNIGLTITLADITEEEFRVLELIEVERQEQNKSGEGAPTPRQAVSVRSNSAVNPPRGPTNSASPP